jgi:hypothetical protein
LRVLVLADPGPEALELLVHLGGHVQLLLVGLHQDQLLVDDPVQHHRSVEAAGRVRHGPALGELGLAQGLLEFALGDDLLQGADRDLGHRLDRGQEGVGPGRIGGVVRRR